MEGKKWKMVSCCGKHRRERERGREGGRGRAHLQSEETQGTQIEASALRRIGRLEALEGMVGLTRVGRAWLEGGREGKGKSCEHSLSFYLATLPLPELWKNVSRSSLAGVS